MEIKGADRNRWVQMGADGYLWVLWVAGGTRGTQTRQTDTKMIVHRNDLGPMAGEISPNIMFCDDSQKVVLMGADRYKWVRMGAAGCRGTEGTENKRKWGLHGREGLVLGRMVTATKNRK